MKSLLTLVVLMTTSLFASAQSYDPRRTVHVEGQAQAHVVPDRAVITLGVETEGPNAATVKADNDKSVRTMLSALKKIGVKDENISTTSLSLQPVYNYRPDGRREFVKYVMRNTVVVTIRDLSMFDAILSQGVISGGNVVDDIAFAVSNEKAIRDSLRIEAVKDARTRAEAVATAAGTRVGKPITISATNGYHDPQPYLRNVMMKAEDASGSTVSGGQLVIRMNVSATFELE